jgi:Cellulase (glycosyl hydrolase family 5)
MKAGSDMKPRTATLIIITLTTWCFASAQQLPPGYDRLFRPADAALYHVPIGLCEDYPEETTTPEIIRGDMEFLKRRGINLLRISFGWDGIETARGEYNWLFWDEYVRMASEDYGITLIPYICYTPPWNSTGDTTNYWNHTPKDYEAFGTFVETLVNRYKKRIKTWELWNEPDIDAYWSGSAADLARLTKIGAQAVRRADPTAKIVLAGLAHRTEFTRELFRDHGISPFVDVVNCHSYFETWSGEPLEKLPDYINTLTDIIATYGNHQSLWMAEVGYSTFRRPDGYVSSSYMATYDYEHTLRYQAVALWRTLTLLLSTEKVAAIAWYELKDLPPQENVIGDVNNRNLGVAFVGYAPKPAAQALSFFNRFFGQKSASLDNDVTVSKSLNSESVVHAFRMGDGTVAVIGWLKTNIRGKVLDGPKGNLTDRRVETLGLSVPASGKISAAWFDELGNERPATIGQPSHGRIAIPGFTLKGGEITILRISKK